jgi:hypothetical protein
MPKSQLNDLRQSRRLIRLRPQRAFIAPKALTFPASTGLCEHHLALDHVCIPLPPSHPVQL